MRKLRFITVAMAAGCAACALAGPVVEGESDGQAINNALGSAQFIPAGAFTANSSPDVFGNLGTASVRGRAGGDDIDVFSFASPGGLAYFDIDGGASGFDSYLALFDSMGTLLADNDDSFPGDPGSASDLDAFLGSVTLRNAGLYYIVVASSGNAALATFTGDEFFELSRPDGAFGGFAFGNADLGDSSFARSGPQMGAEYMLHISVPAPATPALALGALALLSRRRR